MSRSTLTITLSLIATMVLAQAEPHVCGQITTPEQIAHLKANNPNLNLSFRSSMDTIRVPVLFHRIADENGNGAVSETDCANALIELNALYAPGRIVFEECESPRLISDSTFYDYEYSEEFALRQAHEVSGVINVFIPNRASSTSGGQVCGYAYLPPTRRDITIVKASCFTNGTTFPHEVGHFLGLYHTHGTSNCGSLTDELVDGSNCATRGDDVCDTPADPNLLGIDCDRYVVNSSCVYTGTEVDANGDPFAPDTRNIMSYSRKACRQHFSTGQLDRVRFYLETSRSYLTCPSDVCMNTDPDIWVFDWSMTEVTFFVVDNGQQSTEIEYTVVGGATTTLTTTQSSVTINGFSPCDSIIVRARNVCDNGFGEWSAYDDIRLDGCGLQYCPQPNNNLLLDVDDLEVGNTQLPDLVTLDNYGIHAGVVSVVLNPTNPFLSLSFDSYTDPRNGPDSMYVQVWIDQDFDNELEASENLLQVKAAADTYFNTSLFIDPSLPRNQLMRMRVTTSVSSFINPCETENGETEDLNIVFIDDDRTATWVNETLEIEAPSQQVTVPLLAELDWSLNGLPTWLSANATNGSANDLEVTFSVERNVSCEARTATLMLVSEFGDIDELVVTQLPTAPGISLSINDTLEVGPLESAIEFTSTSLHTYEGASTEPWLPFTASTLLDEVDHQISVPINAEVEDRISHINFNGCDATAGFVVKQEVGRTSWVDPADVQLTAVGDTVMLDVASNVDWDGLTNASWLSALGIAGSGNGRVMYIYTGGAANGETAEIVLNGYFGLTEGQQTVTVIAPFVSGTSSPILSEKLMVSNPIADRLIASTVSTGIQGASPQRATSVKTYQWSVYSSIGQRMHTSFGESLNLNTSDWPAGTYMLKLEDEAGRILSERVMKF